MYALADCTECSGAKPCIANLVKEKDRGKKRMGWTDTKKCVYRQECCSFTFRCPKYRKCRCHCSDTKPEDLVSHIQVFQNSRGKYQPKRNDETIPNQVRRCWSFVRNNVPIYQLRKDRRCQSFKKHDLHQQWLQHGVGVRGCVKRDRSLFRGKAIPMNQKMII